MIYECTTMTAALRILKRQAKRGREVLLEARDSGRITVTVTLEAA